MLEKLQRALASLSSLSGADFDIQCVRLKSVHPTPKEGHHGHSTYTSERRFQEVRLKKHGELYFFLWSSLPGSLPVSVFHDKRNCQGTLAKSLQDFVKTGRGSSRKRNRMS